MLRVCSVEWLPGSLTHTNTQCHHVYGGEIANTSRSGDQMLPKACGGFLSTEADWDWRIGRVQDHQAEGSIEADRARCDRRCEHAHD
jgi:hypothetical protein